jgi:hypothetical protein
MTEASVQTATGVPGDFPAPGTPEPQIVDYFAFAETHRWFFPDGVQWIEFKVMTEGDKARFQRKTNRDIKINQRTQDATVQLDAAAERHELIKMSCVNWLVYARQTPDSPMMPVAFSVSGSGINLEKWLSVTNPKLVEDLELAIRKANPWMQADMTVEAIDEEIERLNELRAEAEKRASGN